MVINVQLSSCIKLFFNYIISVMRRHEKVVEQICNQ
tara:strand:+ start:53835 stop:53942 length:108 start_codon:yes stop_codon:yes gene_type:complete